MLCVPLFSGVSAFWIWVGTGRSLSLTPWAAPLVAPPTSVSMPGWPLPSHHHTSGLSGLTVLLVFLWAPRSLKLLSDSSGPHVVPGLCFEAPSWELLALHHAPPRTSKWAPSPHTGRSRETSHLPTASLCARLARQGLFLHWAQLSSPVEWALAQCPLAVPPILGHIRPSTA